MSVPSIISWLRRSQWGDVRAHPDLVWPGGNLESGGLLCWLGHRMCQPRLVMLRARLCATMIHPCASFERKTNLSECVCAVLAYFISSINEYRYDFIDGLGHIGET